MKETQFKITGKGMKGQRQKNESSLLNAKNAFEKKIKIIFKMSKTILLLILKQAYTTQTNKFLYIKNSFEKNKGKCHFVEAFSSTIFFFLDYFCFSLPLFCIASFNCSASHCRERCHK